MHRRAPVTARLRDQSDAPLVIETAPMAINGENGSSQKKATLRTASSFAIRPGVASTTTVFMAQALALERNTPRVGIAWDFCQEARSSTVGGGPKPYINPRSQAA